MTKHLKNILVCVVTMWTWSASAQVAPPKIQDEPEFRDETRLDADVLAQVSGFAAHQGDSIDSENVEDLVASGAETQEFVEQGEIEPVEVDLERGSEQDALADRPLESGPDAAEALGMERLSEEVATSDPTTIQVDPSAELRKAELDAFLTHLKEIQVMDAIRSRTGSVSLWPTRARKHRDVFDLSPYVAHAEWKRATDLFESGSCRDALVAAKKAQPTIDTSTPSGVRYAFARFQMCGGEESAGRKSMQELALLNSPVGNLARKRLGMKVEKDVSVDEEGAYLSQKLKDAKERARKDVVGSLKELEDLHGQMINSWDRYRVRLAQAEVLEAAGRVDEAGQAYLDIYRKTRGWKVNGSIEDRIQALERRHKKTFLTYGERIDRMRHLVARGRYSDARQVSVENAKIRKVSGNEIRGWTKYREALQAERDKKRDRANTLFAEADKLVRDPEVRVRLYIGWARSLRRTNQDSRAIGLYEQLCKEYNEHYLCEEAMYEAGRLLQFQNEHARAQEKFRIVIERNSGEFTADALWRSGFSYHLTGDWAKSIARLERLRADHGEEKDESELTQGLKASYWIAMNHYRAGEKAKARTAFQATIENGKLTWYGRLAAGRMNEAGWIPVVRVPRSKMTAADLEDLGRLQVPTNPRLEVAKELVKLGFWKDALAELKDQTAILPVPEGAHTMLASVHLARGDASWAHWTMKKHIAEAGPTEESLRDWGTAFPLAYMDLAHKHSKNSGVSPFLVQAIMRQESGFRPTVKSWAGAVGLMQLMPGTAAWTARTFMEDQKFTQRQLLDTDTNVRLGSMYIRVHTAHSNDHIPMALAGYNAGAGALQSWFKRYGDRETDAFVESITYQEARGYVRKVMTSYITYSSLYGGGLVDVPLKVPKDLGKWGVVPERRAPAVSLQISSVPVLAAR